MIIRHLEDVYLAFKKKRFICKYRILSGFTNHLHDHEEFLFIIFIITLDELCSRQPHRYLHARAHTLQHTSNPSVHFHTQH